jgi:hypothetical protein
MPAHEMTVKKMAPCLIRNLKKLKFLFNQFLEENKNASTTYESINGKIDVITWKEKYECLTPRDSISFHQKTSPQKSCLQPQRSVCKCYLWCILKCDFIQTGLN